LSGIAEQVHNDSTPRDRFINIEQILAGNPAILNCFLPGCTVLSNANYDIEAIVAEIETLTVALRSVSDQSEGIVLEVVLERLAGVGMDRLSHRTRSFSLGQSSRSAVVSMVLSFEGSSAHHRQSLFAQQNQLS
jgi:hypothetical protein